MFNKKILGEGETSDILGGPAKGGLAKVRPGRVGPRTRTQHTFFLLEENIFIFYGWGVQTKGFLFALAKKSNCTKCRVTQTNVVSNHFGPSGSHQNGVQREAGQDRPRNIAKHENTKN